MFYRRKIILALLELFDGELEKIRLQKLLFLFCKKQSKPDYEFIPYKFGCFSYSAYADLATMVKKGQLSEDANSFVKSDKPTYFSLLKADDKTALQNIKVSYGSMSSNALMKLTYQKYPFWALNSVKAKSLLSKEEMIKVEEARPTNDKTILYTIGYEGNSLENYLNRLIENDIKVLIDVRNNPLSMKFGFSKSQLKRYCESIGIGYFHFPDVGIISEKRQDLNTQADYDKLFREYRVKTLPNTQNTQKEILDLLVKYKRVALTCFEAQYCRCHRASLADAIKNLRSFSYKIEHI
jgi:uncharacterized protein (DUF488 family)